MYLDHQRWSNKKEKLSFAPFLLAMQNDDGYLWTFLVSVPAMSIPTKNREVPFPVPLSLQEFYSMYNMFIIPD